MQGAWKVGLLVLVGIGLLLGAYQIVAQRIVPPQTFTVYADFPDAGGILPGARVLMSGVRVGQVRKIELAGPKTARLTLEIERDTPIPTGTTATIPASLIGLGDVPVTLIPPAQDTGTRVAAGETLKGTRGSPLTDSFPELKTTLEQVNGLLTKLQAAVPDESLTEEIKKLIQTSERTVASFGALSGQFQGLIAENRGQLQALLKSFTATAESARQASRAAAAFISDPTWQKDAKEIVATLNSTATRADALVANVNQLLTDPSLRQPLSGTMANVEKITDSGTRIAANTEEITKNGIEISKNVAELTRKANELADQTAEALKKLQQFFERVPGRGGLPRVSTSMDLLRESSPDRWRTDFNATLAFKDGNFHLGIFDAFESNKINAQWGQPILKGAEYRYGIYASKPGVGVSLPIAPRFSLRGDLFDINDPRLDLRARLEFGSGLTGWLGVNRVFGDNALVGGIGIRR